MPVTSVTKDPENLTLTVVADFAAPLQRVWDAYTDPRQLEKFWGPPEWPATFTRHDVFPGGKTHYFMTGPDGSAHGGYWDWIDVKQPEGASASFEVRDGFSTDLDGTPNTDMPTGRMVFHFEATDTGSRVTVTSFHNSADEFAQVIEMGQEEGMREAMGQIDDVLADLSSFAHGVGTKTDILSDTQIRVSRIIRGSVEDVWRAHHEPALLQQWMLGPDGWTMPVCEVSTEVGGKYRYEWASDDGENRFGFEGEVLEMEAPLGAPPGATLGARTGGRSVTTERFVGPEGFHSPETTINELTLTPQESGTLLSVVITYPNAEVRDTVLATGMTDGMEASYARLESVLV
ncbi:MAG TPA: SRPBCC family protein [Aeromicrobium sp.]|nr:SRPBCC family protein [Aeromicrobium sp.]